MSAASDEASPGLEEEIRALLAEQDRHWRALDMRALFRMWDPGEVAPVYIGGEYPAPIVGRGELGRHWGRLGGRITMARTRSTLAHARPVARDVVIAVYLSEWEFETADTTLRHAGQDWVSAVLRHTDEGWRFIYQAESPTFNAVGSALDAATSCAGRDDD